jgi:hypothetical protein
MHNGGSITHVLVLAYMHEAPYLLRARRWSAVPLEDREDALQQAMLELLRADAACGPLTDIDHAKRALATRYNSRLCDLYRARAGRGRDALMHRGGELDPAMPTSADLTQLVELRADLRAAVEYASNTPLSPPSGSAEARKKRIYRYRARLTSVRPW